MQQNQLFCMKWDKWSQARSGFMFPIGSSHAPKGASSNSGLWNPAKFTASFFPWNIWYWRLRLHEAYSIEGLLVICLSSVWPFSFIKLKGCNILTICTPSVKFWPELANRCFAILLLLSSSTTFLPQHVSLTHAPSTMICRKDSKARLLKTFFIPCHKSVPGYRHLYASDENITCSRQRKNLWRIWPAWKCLLCKQGWKANSGRRNTVRKGKLSCYRVI